MRRLVPVFLIALACAVPVRAAGLLIPSDKSVAPLDLVNHRVAVAIDEQVAVTKVEQTFRNHTDRQLEATYVFPVPKGASVSKFAMWVNGKEVKGEMVEADRAATIYTDIVRRMQDPGLLEYMGNNLLRLRVFPILPHADQKVSISFTCVNSSDAGLTEYVYPLHTDGKASRTLEKFTLDATIKSQHGVQNVYSPTHAVKVTRTTDHEAHVQFEAKGGTLDKDFQLFYSLTGKDVGLTVLTYKPVKDEDGYFLMLLSPRAELSKSHEVARDMVFVLDTSGSMAGPKMEQAKKALKFCLSHLGSQDRFAVMNFATTVNKYADHLQDADETSIRRARRWVDQLEATGGTAIDAAMADALAMRANESDRTFTIVFFTDGQPTVGETNPDAILKNVMAKRTENTRIFTFGVGDDVNAVLLDRLADETRAISTYVRPEEDIEVKVSALYDKISHPVITNLGLSPVCSSGMECEPSFTEMYPRTRELPDLFHGGQLIILGRYRRHGTMLLTMTGKASDEVVAHMYSLEFAQKTNDDRAFIAELWARRKVGYLLDQIRVNGEQKELKDEVIALAKKYGIATPYTSYLVVPDMPAPTLTMGVRVSPLPPLATPAPQYFNHLSQTGDFVDGTYGRSVAPALVPAPSTAAGSTAATGAGRIDSAPVFISPTMQWAVPTGANTAAPTPPLSANKETTFLRGANDASIVEPLSSSSSVSATAQTGTEGVKLALVLDDLRNSDKIAHAATKPAFGRTCVEVNGAWVDNGFDAKMTTLKVKAMSAAYFRILARHPEMKDVFRLGNRLVWVAPNGTALLIDADGKETLSDDEIDKLFVKK